MNIMHEQRKIGLFKVINKLISRKVLFDLNKNQGNINSSYIGLNLIKIISFISYFVFDIFAVNIIAKYLFSHKILKLYVVNKIYCLADLISKEKLHDVRVSCEKIMKDLSDDTRLDEIPRNYRLTVTIF